MGGAIFTQGALTLQRTTLSGNTAQGGSGNNHAAGYGGGGIGENAIETDDEKRGGGFGGPAPGAVTGNGAPRKPSVDGIASAGGGFGAGDTPTGLDFCNVCVGGGKGGFGGALSGRSEVGDGGAAGSSPNAAGAGGDLGHGGDWSSGGGGVGGGGGPGAFAAHVGSAGGSGGFGGGGGGTSSSEFGNGGFGGGGGGNGGFNSYSGRAGYGAGSAGDGSGGGGAGMGGAVFSLFATVTIDDSTLSGNAALGGTAGGNGLGGALFNVDGTVAVSGSTIASNTANGASGVGGLFSMAFGNTITTGAATTATATIAGSVLYGNTNQDLAADLIDGRSTNTSTVTLTGQNVVGASGALHTATITGSPITADPQLAPLGDNGGWLATMRPASAGSAHDAGSACGGTDELGNARGGAPCDLGALALGTSLPSAATSTPTAITTTGATLNGTVAPAGAATSYRFELSRDDAFTSIITVPGGSVGPAGGAVAVSANATGLAPGTAYAYRLVAANNAGSATSTPLGHLTTEVPPPPVVATSTPTTITRTSATLQGTVNPRGYATNYAFQLSTHADCSEPIAPPFPTRSAGSGTTAVPVTASATGLSENTTYYACLVATSDGGTVTSSPAQAFTTLPFAPAVTTAAPTPLAQTTARLRGSVDPQGASTSYHFVLSAAADCSNPLVTTPDADAGAGDGDVPASADVTGLTASTTYYACLTATNAGGSTTSTPAQAFTTLPPVPVVTTGAATALGTTTVTLAGTVDPGGVTAAVRFQLSTDAAFTAPIALPERSVTVAGPVSAAANGLRPGTTYHYRLVATNPGGTSTGAARSFTTTGLPFLPPRHDGAASSSPSPAAPTNATAPGPAPGSDGGAATQPAATITKLGTARVTRHDATLRVTDNRSMACRAGAAACRARLVVTALGPKRTTGKRTRVVIARAVVTAPAGAQRRLTITLNATGRRLLRARHRLTATVTITTTGADGRRHSIRHRVVLRMPAHRPAGETASRRG